MVGDREFIENVCVVERVEKKYEAAESDNVW